jgi:5-oxoprolinase (ATP-hydrolysing)
LGNICELEPLISIPIFPDKANEMFLKLLNEIDSFYGIQHDPVEILKGLESIGNEKMADAIRSISLAKGFNPRDYPLLAFGGAGGLHACAIADLLGINTILIPYDAGILSAFGIGKAKIERYAEREIRMPLDLAEALSTSVVKELTTRCEKDLFLAGIIPKDIDAPQIYYFLRFSGQESSLEIQSTCFTDLSGVFQEEYKKIFGYSPAGRPIELVKITCKWLKEELKNIESNLNIIDIRLDIQFNTIIEIIENIEKRIS